MGKMLLRMLASLLLEAANEFILQLHDHVREKEAEAK